MINILTPPLFFWKIFILTQFFSHDLNIPVLSDCSSTLLDSPLCLEKNVTWPVVMMSKRWPNCKAHAPCLPTSIMHYSIHVSGKMLCLKELMVSSRSSVCVLNIGHQNFPNVLASKRYVVFSVVSDKILQVTSLLNTNHIVSTLFSNIN